MNTEIELRVIFRDEKWCVTMDKSHYGIFPNKTSAIRAAEKIEKAAQTLGFEPTVFIEETA